MITERFVQDAEAEKVGIWMEHLDGVPWYEAPKPHWPHLRHWVQTRGRSGGVRLVERCPCGAMRLNGRGWMR